MKRIQITISQVKQKFLALELLSRKLACNNSANQEMATRLSLQEGYTPVAAEG